MTRDAFGRPAGARAALTAMTGRPRRGDCPDCDAHSRLVQHIPGVWVLEIRHDDTCPAWLARHNRKGIK